MTLYTLVMRCDSIQLNLSDEVMIVCALLLMSGREGKFRIKNVIPLIFFCDRTANTSE